MTQVRFKKGIVEKRRFFLLLRALIVDMFLIVSYPDCVKLDRIDDIKHWFAKSARKANKSLGDKMVEKSLEHLKTR